MSKKHIIIIVIASLLLVMGGAGGSYYFFKLNAPASRDANAIAGAAIDNEMAESKESIFYNMADPMIVNFPKGLKVGFVQLSVSFLAANDQTVTALKKHEPMLRNNLMMKINAQNPEQLKTRVGKEALRAILLDEVNQVLSKMATGSRIREVFFTAFVMQ